MVWATVWSMHSYIFKCAEFAPKRLRAAPSHFCCSWHSQFTSLMGSSSTAAAPGWEQQRITTHVCRCSERGDTQAVDLGLSVQPLPSFMLAQHVQMQRLRQPQQQLMSAQHMPASPAFSTTTDAFTRSLQQKTEQDVLNLLETARAAKLAEAAAAESAEAEAGADEDDTVDIINPETGEAYGPRGKEPTRYGDWEIKGRCTDFS